VPAWPPAASPRMEMVRIRTYPTAHRANGSHAITRVRPRSTHADPTARDRRHVRQRVRRDHRETLFQGHPRPGNAATRARRARPGDPHADDDRQPRDARSRPRTDPQVLPRAWARRSRFSPRGCCSATRSRPASATSCARSMRGSSAKGRSTCLPCGWYPRSRSSSSTWSWDSLPCAHGLSTGSARLACSPARWSS